MKVGKGLVGASGQLAVLLVTGAFCGFPPASAVTASAAPAAQGAPGVSAAAPVYTRARLVSMEADAGGNVTYVRLKLLPRAKLPFTIQTFRVVNPALLRGIPQGAWVQFTALHIDDENTLTSIRVTAECKRFERCD
ncbi:hypothetical protein [Acidovorax sp. Q11]